MNELEMQYPEDCPFCGIASAFPFSEPPSSSSSSSSLSRIPLNPTSSITISGTPESSLQKHIPSTVDADPTKTSPSSFVVLASEHVVAFLDILPMTEGHLLVATRGHRRTVGEMEIRESREIGE